MHKIVLSINALQKGLKKFFDLLGRKVDVNIDRVLSHILPPNTPSKAQELGFT